jgi:hypothetical protein
LVRTEGARLGLAHADASEPHATSALADERLNQRRRSQDDTAPREHERGGPEDHREALDDTAQGDCEAQHRQAEHREARDRKTGHGQARRPQDRDAPSDRRAFDREAHDAPQLRDPQEAPLSQVSI